MKYDQYFFPWGGLPIGTPETQRAFPVIVVSLSDSLMKEPCTEKIFFLPCGAEFSGAWGLPGVKDSTSFIQDIYIYPYITFLASESSFLMHNP